MVIDDCRAFFITEVQWWWCQRHIPEWRVSKIEKLFLVRLKIVCPKKLFRDSKVRRGVRLFLCQRWWPQILTCKKQENVRKMRVRKRETETDWLRAFKYLWVSVWELGTWYIRRLKESECGSTYLFLSVWEVGTYVCLSMFEVGNYLCLSVLR